MLTTFSLIRYRGFPNKYWALSMMQRAKPSKEIMPGPIFYKILGTGSGNGFSPYPDFSLYAFLGVWENEKTADDFLNDSHLFTMYRKRSEGISTVYMKALRTHGLWDGKNPFVPESSPPPGEQIAILTRASISLRHLRKFWTTVPAVSAALESHSGLIFNKGVGELPLTRMATFSLWENEDSMNSYAYKNSKHLEAVRLTRTLNWYTEELFARFRPYRYEGRWNVY